MATSAEPEGASLVAEFDAEVKERVSMIRRNAENTARNMNNALDLILTSLPASIRQMPIRQLVDNFGGDIQRAAAQFCPASREPPLSLSDLLLQKAADGAPPQPRTPTSVTSSGCPAGMWPFVASAAAAHPPSISVYQEPRHRLLPRP